MKLLGLAFFTEWITLEEKSSSFYLRKNSFEHCVTHTVSSPLWVPVLVTDCGFAITDKLVISSLKSVSCFAPKLLSMASSWLWYDGSLWRGGAQKRWSKKRASMFLFVLFPARNLVKILLWSSCLKTAFLRWECDMSEGMTHQWKGVYGVN